MLSGRGSADGGLVVYRYTGGVDAIDQYSRWLVHALQQGGLPTRYLQEGLPLDRSRFGRVGWVLIQYNPFSYGRWGVAPRLLLAAAALRRRSGLRLGVVVHEAWVPVHDWRSLLMGTYQRGQLRSLLALADVVLVTTEGLATKFGQRTVHIPVASNIQPISTREAARTQLGYAEELVVSMFGTSHPTGATEHAMAAISALVEERGASGLRVLNLGANAPSLDLRAGVNVDSPGAIPADDLSRLLHASDMLLLPYTDGLSTRRTTLMAGLAHAVPVVGLSGPQTDQVLLSRPDALVLTSADQLHSYVNATVTLAADVERRRAIGAAGQRLYATTFDWPILAKIVRAALLEDDGSEYLQDSATDSRPGFIPSSALDEPYQPHPP